MFLSVLEPNKSTARGTLLCSAAAQLNVVRVLLHSEHLVAEWTVLRLHVTPSFVVSKLNFACFKCTILTLDKGMGFRFVLLFLALGDDLAALTTLVVHPGASNLMHAELTDLNGPLTGATLLCLFLLLHHFFVCCFPFVLI